MVNPIYPGGRYPVGGVAASGKKSDAAHTRISEQRYDQVQFSSHLDEMEKRIKETEGHISQEIRVRPTRQELAELSRQVSTGEYQCNPKEIAARMLLMREDG